MRAVVDATQDLLVNVLPYHPFLIKPNDHELGEIVGRELKTDEEITAAARALQEKGCPERAGEHGRERRSAGG